MSVQKISNNFYPLKKNNSCHKAPDVGFDFRKQVTTKDFLYTLPVNISFKANSSIHPCEDAQFLKSLDDNYRLKPDKFQIQGANYLFNGNDTLVCAPTGTGKTLIAEYVINKNLKDGKRTFYTAPLKALSNQMYTDFCKLFGKDNVGVMTGDIKFKENAPVVIMTTEIYRNMLLGSDKNRVNQTLSNVGTVVYDEFHYMNDPERGEVWESSIMYTPDKVQQLFLSATVENAPVVSKWVNRLLAEKCSSRTCQIVDISPNERHVPLKYFVYDPARSKSSLIPLMIEKYDLKKLSRCLYDKANQQFTEKQKEVLSFISNKAQGDGSLKHGLNVLNDIVNEKTGRVEQLENALIKKMGIEPLIAKRIAAILSDSSQQKINDALLVNQSKNRIEQASNDSAPRYANKKKINELMLAVDMLSNKKQKPFARLAQLMSGDSDVVGGLIETKKIVGNQNVSEKELRETLLQLGLDRQSANDIAKEITVQDKPATSSVEFELIDVLNKKDMLPAIFFSFSKKKCDSLSYKYIKSGKSLLTDEEQKLASQIIQKHIEKGSFLGTFDMAKDFLSGVAVHHAGKLPGYKALVEELAQNKLLKIVFATSTLGAGINVPAKTVVFTQLDHYSSEQVEKTGVKFVDLTSSETKQMSGRAGRRGHDYIGNVIVIPDDKHPPSRIFNLITSAPDPIKSNFKPTYGFLSSLISINKTVAGIEDVVEKSFLKEQLESTGQKNDKILDLTKQEFKKKANVLLDKELDCFESIDGKLYPTIKGEIVAKTRGVDSLLFAETILNLGLEHLSPEELAAVACTFTPVDTRFEQSDYGLSDKLSDVFLSIDRLKEKIECIKDKYNTNEKAFTLNRFDSQFVMQWAEATSPDSIVDWKKIIRAEIPDNKKFSEGDLLQAINNTIDILKQIKEITRFACEEYKTEENTEMADKMKAIYETAQKSIKLLQKEPVDFSLE